MEQQQTGGEQKIKEYINRIKNGEQKDKILESNCMAVSLGILNGLAAMPNLSMEQTPKTWAEYCKTRKTKNLDLEIRHRSFVDEGIIRLFDALPDRAHPMATMGAATMALSAYYKDHLHLEDEEVIRTMQN